MLNVMSVVRPGIRLMTSKLGIVWSAVTIAVCGKEKPDGSFQGPVTK